MAAFAHNFVLGMLVISLLQMVFVYYGAAEMQLWYTEVFFLTTVIALATKWLPSCYGPKVLGFFIVCMLNAVALPMVFQTRDYLQFARTSILLGLLATRMLVGASMGVIFKSIQLAVLVISAIVISFSSAEVVPAVSLSDIFYISVNKMIYTNTLALLG